MVTIEQIQAFIDARRTFAIDQHYAYSRDESAERLIAAAAPLAGWVKLPSIEIECLAANYIHKALGLVDAEAARRLKSALTEARARIAVKLLDIRPVATRDESNADALGAIIDRAPVPVESGADVSGDEKAAE